MGAQRPSGAVEFVSERSGRRRLEATADVHGVPSGEVDQHIGSSASLLP